MAEKIPEQPADASFDDLVFSEEDGSLTPEGRQALEARLQADPSLRQTRSIHHLDGRILKALADLKASDVQAASEVMCRIDTLKRSLSNGQLMKRTTKSFSNGAFIVQTSPRIWRRAWMDRLISAAVVTVIAVGIWFAIHPRSATVSLPASETLAELLDSSAEVKISRGGQLQPGGAALKLQSGDAIRTGDGGMAFIVYPDGTRLTLKANSNLVLNSSSVSPATGGKHGGKTALLSLGSLVAEVAPLPPGKPFTFNTPCMSVVVIGTKFELEASDASTQLQVVEGKVRCTNLLDGQSSEVAAGQYVLAEEGFPFSAQEIGTHIWPNFTDGPTYFADDFEQETPGIWSTEKGSTERLRYTAFGAHSMGLSFGPISTHLISKKGSKWSFRLQIKDWTDSSQPDENVARLVQPVTSEAFALEFDALLGRDAVLWVLVGDERIAVRAKPEDAPGSVHCRIECASKRLSETDVLLRVETWLDGTRTDTQYFNKKAGATGREIRFASSGSVSIDNVFIRTLIVPNANSRRLSAPQNSENSQKVNMDSLRATLHPAFAKAHVGHLPKGEWELNIKLNQEQQ